MRNSLIAPIAITLSMSADGVHTAEMRGISAAYDLLLSERRSYVLALIANGDGVTLRGVCPMSGKPYVNEINGGCR